MTKIFLTFLLFMGLPSRADIWVKPIYTPDENHLPHEEQQEEITEDESVKKKHQNVETPQGKIEKEEKWEASEEVDLSEE